MRVRGWRIPVASAGCARPHPWGRAVKPKRQSNTSYGATVMRQKAARRNVRAARPPTGQLNLFAHTLGVHASRAKSASPAAEHTKRVALRYCLRGHPDIHGDKYCRVCGALVIGGCPKCGAGMFMDLSREAFSQYDLDRRREILVRERPSYCTYCGACLPWAWRVKTAQLWQQVFGLIEVARKSLTILQGWRIE